MGKRKRGEMNGDGTVEMKKQEESSQVPSGYARHGSREAPTKIQIVVGTYEKVVHGITATISYGKEKSTQKQPDVEFADSFLLKPHNAAIRCLAVSPPKSDTVLLASGSSDQEIQVYQLSTRHSFQPKLIDPLTTSEMGDHKTRNTENKSLGALQHHGGVINALCFPSRSKLLSAADDCTIAVTRTLDWTSLSTIRTPIPKAQGRPSGDTAPLGGTPAGVSDFAVHPSKKLMLSVGKGEKCMRLWNLVTGKKAGVLNFERNVLQAVGEGKWASGEGRKVRWNNFGEEFVVAFERGCLVYGIDSQPKCRIQPFPTTKIHQLRYFSIPQGEDTDSEYLALSTEDGRLLFYRANLPATFFNQRDANDQLKVLQPVAQFGGPSDGLTGRIKDFEILRLPGGAETIFVACGSDGTIRSWIVEDIELTDDPNVRLKADNEKPNGFEGSSDTPEPVGQLVGLYESKHRITCVVAFLMSKQSGHNPRAIQNGNGLQRGGAEEDPRER